MEDSVGEEERREQGEAMAQAVKARQEDEREPAATGGAGGRGGEPGEEGGFLSSVASKIGAAMSGANEISGEDRSEVNAAAAPRGEEDRREDGNGGGGIFQKLMSSSHAPSPDSGASETEEVKGEERNQGAGAEQGGILSAMASKIGMTMSGANGNGSHVNEDHAKTTNGDAVDHIMVEQKEEKGHEDNGGGILSAMASKIGMAMSGANGNGNHSTEDDAKMSNCDAVDHTKSEDKEEKGDESNGGMLSTMASKIGMAMSGANGEGNHGSTGDDAKTNNGKAVHRSKSEEEKGDEANGVGLVDQIMSNLPSDDQAPEADEASLLIAIIED